MSGRRGFESVADEGFAELALRTCECGGEADRLFMAGKGPVRGGAGEEGPAVAEQAACLAVGLG